MSQDGGAEGYLNSLMAAWLNDAFAGLKGETGAQGSGWPCQVEKGINGTFVGQDDLQQRRSEGE